MGFGKARARANRQGDKRRARQAAQPDRSGDERAPDLWDMPGVRYPGNPKGGRSDPISIQLVDARGERVEFAVRRKKHYRNTGTEPSVVWLWQPIVAEQLWSGSWHHAITHALRLLQASSANVDELGKKAHATGLRGDIQPQQLLEACGAKRSFAGELIALLCEHDLLHEQEAGGKNVWLVTTLYNGVGGNWELYTRQEIPDGILPEFLDNPPVKPADELEGDTVSDDEQDGTEQPLLVQAYEWLMAQVPQNTPAVDGYQNFTVQGQLKDLLTKDLKVTDSMGQSLLNKLTAIGVYKSNRGPNPQRWLKPNAGDEVAIAAAEEPKQSRRSAPKPAAQPVNQPPADSATLEEGRPMTPEEAYDYIVQLIEKLNWYVDVIAGLAHENAELEQDKARLEVELAETLQALEAARAARPVLLLREGMDRHLNTSKK